MSSKGPLKFRPRFNFYNGESNHYLSVTTMDIRCIPTKGKLCTFVGDKEAEKSKSEGNCSLREFKHKMLNIETEAFEVGFDSLLKHLQH